MLNDLRTLFDDLGKRLRLAGPGPIVLDDHQWQALEARVPFLAALSTEEIAILRERIGEFLAAKHFVAIGLDLQPWQRHVIAAYACLPVLHLGTRAYREWKTVIVYPDTFTPEQEWVDDAGVHHHAVVPQAGEAWERGPVVLSWNDIAADGAVIVHEMTHTLDAGNGDVNGFPPLPARMPATAWTETFSAAFEQLNDAIERDEEPLIDPYAATDPAEFLAVASEYFFFSPGYLREVFPGVYAQLADYFGQQPHLRAPEIETGLPEGTN
ncbi:M90 family metallopeptidase [Thioalkalivibrio paradoxus]|uniref:M90 family metallopeptidase n=1 Tax=Thioalkalivibrio paradoxus TaxID=108010 RepID=UPI00022C2BFA|nr:M90 family metallopeptidase [Thioalkalivibrio paradoxus]